MPSHRLPNGHTVRRMNPTALRDRLRNPGPSRPGRLRAVTVRRIAAALLLGAAVVLLIVGREGERYDLIVVAAHDLRPGVVLTDGDLRLARLPAGADLAGTIGDPAVAVGGRLTGAVHAGEVLTGSRLLSSRLPSALTGDGSARLVPVRPADPAVAGLLRAGDVVDVVDEEARVLAADAVVAVPAAAPSRSMTGAGADASAPVLLAIGRGPAHRVAAAGLANALTLVLH